MVSAAFSRAVRMWPGNQMMGMGDRASSTDRC
jgi:hypothetical protein